MPSLKMLRDKVIRTAFIISLAGHGLLLGMPRFSFEFPHLERPAEISVRIEIEKPLLLPKIDIMGEEKKLANSKSQIANRKPAEIISDKQLPKSDMQVIEPAQEAMLRYQDMVRQRIEEVRRYPFWAKRQGIEGTVYLSFVVLANGTSQDIRIINSTGSKILDNEAIATIKRAAPFPSIPREISQDFVSMEVSIVFTLQ